MFLTLLNSHLIDLLFIIVDVANSLSELLYIIALYKARGNPGGRSFAALQVVYGTEDQITVTRNFEQGGCGLEMRREMEKVRDTCWLGDKKIGRILFLASVIK